MSGNKFFLFLILMGLTAPEMSQANSCDNLATTESVVQCALEMAPDMVRGQTEVSRAEALEDQAGQRPNPEFSSDGTYGTALGDTVWNINASLVHTVEVGGKRSARIEKAQGELSSSKAGFLKAKERTVIETLRLLNRMRQIKDESDALDEALATFSKILKQYFRKSALGPEQQVSLSIFQLAESDYRLRRNTLEIETISLQRRMSAILGRAADLPENAFPKSRSTWPKIEEQQESSKWTGSLISFPRAELQLAKADLELARSQSWSNLRVGPAYQLQTQGPLVTHMWGASLTFDLPLFHMNGGGREVAHREVFKAEQDLEVTTREISATREILLKQYLNTVAVLKQSVTRQEMEKRHRNVEALFERGVISSPLVIEAHRQMVDFTRDKNSQEIAALEALWQLLALEGRLFEEYL